MVALSDPVDYLLKELEPSRNLLLKHSLFSRLRTLPDLRCFMEHHVFAVWDFMSLLKGLQRELTCVRVPWVPQGIAATRRLINEIVLDEESDLSFNGQPTSHFEVYVRAMEECGADTNPIRRLLVAVAAGSTSSQALDAARVPDSVRQFVDTTFSIIGQGHPHILAGALTFGRKDLIPVAFRDMVEGLRQQFPGQLDTFLYYLNRQIGLEGSAHIPLAQQMVRGLCADDPDRWHDCQEVALRCLEARMVLWDGIKPVARVRAPSGK